MIKGKYSLKCEGRAGVSEDEMKKSKARRRSKERRKSKRGAR